MNVYVRRDNGGNVEIVSRAPYEDENGPAGEVLPEDHADVLAFLNPPPGQQDYSAAIQAYVDAAAVTKQFHDGVTLASYTASTNQQWAQEAQAFVAWRDAVWAYAYAEFDKVMAGERSQPTVSDFLNELPVIVWPE